MVNSEQRYWEGSADSVDTGHYRAKGVPCLILRLANMRQAQLCATALHLILLRKEPISAVEINEARRRKYGHTNTYKVNEKEVEISSGGSVALDDHRPGKGKEKETNDEIEEEETKAAKEASKGEEEEENTVGQGQEGKDDDHYTKTIDNKKTDKRWVYRMHELNFELNSQVGRVRATSLSIPLLGLPWTVIHVMDETSPLYG